MANVYDIIIRPIITERSMVDVANKKYVFEVAKDAGKVDNWPLHEHTMLHTHIH